MRNLKFIAGAAIVAIGISTGVAGNYAFAQDTATPGAGAAMTGQGHSGEHQQLFVDSLAANLGLDPAVVETAVTETRIEMVDLRAEMRKAAIASGERPEMNGEHQQLFIDSLAANLGLDPAVVEAAVTATRIEMVDVRAEMMKTAIENGEMPAMRSGHGHAPGGQGAGDMQGEPGTEVTPAEATPATTA